MKRLIDYINESLILEEELTAEKLLEKLPHDEDLSDYVNDLNAMLKDKDAKQILLKAFVTSKDKNAIQFKGDMKFISVKDLHPTQSEIDVNKSLGFPFKGIKEAETNMKLFFENSDKVSMPFPLVTFSGKFILDGHHRWSQVYTFNPECKMQCFDINVASGENINEQDMLKICQGVLAAKRSIDKKGSIPQSKVEGANLFKMSEDQVKETIKGYCKKNEEPAKIIMKYEKVDNTDALADKLCTNLMDLRKNNEEYAKRGNERSVMPQTDRGGNNPDDMKTAKPEVKQSALYALVKGKIDPDVLPK